MLSFKAVQEELSISTTDAGTVIMRDTKLVMPSSLQQQTLDLAHEGQGHQGITKTKALLRSKVWFPNIDRMIEEKVSKCIACAANDNRQKNEPLHMSELPKGPWLKLSIDFCSPLPTGEYLLVIIDEFSCYPVVYVVRSTSAETVMPLLEQTFAIFGFPDVIKSDNVPPFQSHEWKKFLSDRGIKTRRITPLWPQANAQAENFSKPLMKAIRAAVVSKQNWKAALVDFLRIYRSTPHSTTLFSPYKLLFGRDPKTKFPQASDNVEKHPDDDEVRARDNKEKKKMKDYADVKQKRKEKTDTTRDPQQLIISKEKGTMITATYPDGKEIRNKSHLKLVDPKPEELLVREHEHEIKPVINAPENKESKSKTPGGDKLLLMCLLSNASV